MLFMNDHIYLGGLNESLELDVYNIKKHVGSIYVQSWA